MMVTVAPGMTAPVESVTEPRIVPVSTCALAPIAHSANVSPTIGMRLQLQNLTVLNRISFRLPAFPGFPWILCFCLLFLCSVYDNGLRRNKYNDAQYRCQCF